MAKVEMTVTADGTEKKGTLVPTAGGSLKVTAANADAKIGVDYTNPDKLILSMAGDVKLSKEGVTVAGEVDDNLFNGNTTVKGKVTWAVDKDVSVSCNASYGPDGPSGGASLTLKF